MNAPLRREKDHRVGGRRFSVVFGADALSSAVVRTKLATPRRKIMGLVLAPIANDKVAEWKAWMAELTGPRHADFVDFNKRHGLTKHEAWFCETPMGVAVVAIHEGPGAAEMMMKVAQSAFLKMTGRAEVKQETLVCQSRFCGTNGNTSWNSFVKTRGVIQ